jgi:phosphoribosylformimino-5-aminoimidazole carboxamide ribotide isomerase
VLIPSIDLMGGKIVQLVQGDKKALEFSNFEEWVTRFASFPLVQLIDLDAAMGRESNASLIEFFVKRLPCQVGGGIRSIASARKMLDLGAQRVILGSSLIQNGAINVAFARQLAAEFGADKLVFAIDARGGKVAIRGWREITSITPLDMVKALDPFCCAFLYTHIDTEGLMTGLPLEPVRALREATTLQLIGAGGITSHEEIEKLHQMGVDAVVGMALYTGRLSQSV